jgi:hypothetical protein
VPNPTDNATREPHSRVALVTCDLFPDLWDDDFPLRDALRARGIEVDAVRWDDSAADWTTYDLSVLRSPWDYVPRRDEFVAWAARVPRLFNPADVVAWNTDKRYLAELAAAGIPTIPTTFVAPGESWTPLAEGEWVVKPAVSAGSQDTARYLLPEQAGDAAAHAARLTGEGRLVMIQPYLAAVDTAGETAVLCFAGADGKPAVSHAIRKGPMLVSRGESGIDPGSEEITPRTPSPAELDLAARALEVVPGGSGRLLYARVDMIPGPDGEPLLAELELTEPTLFLRFSEGAGDRLAEAIIARL